MPAYNGLKDQHLQSFFYGNKRKLILIKNGLITPEGFIVKKPDEYLKKIELYAKTNLIEIKDKVKNTTENPKVQIKKKTMKISRVNANMLKENKMNAQQSVDKKILKVKSISRVSVDEIVTVKSENSGAILSKESGLVERDHIQMSDEREVRNEDIDMEQKEDAFE